MLRRFLSILCIILILGTSLVVGASAAVPLVTTLYEPENAVVNNFYYEYLALFSDTSGFLIQFRYLSVLSLNVFLDTNGIRFMFTNFLPVDYQASVIVRDATSGRLLGEKAVYVPANSNHTFLLSSLVNVSFSDFHFYQTFPDSHFDLDYNSSYFAANSINWLPRSESGYLLSVLPEPITDHSNAFIVFQSNGGTAYLLACNWTLTDDALDMLDIQLYVDSAGNYSLRVFNTSSASISFMWSLYDVSNGFYYDSGLVSIPANNLSYTTVTLGMNFVSYPNVKTYGISLLNEFSFPVNQPVILWNYDRLNAEAIAAQTLLILNQLYAINRSLGDIEDVLIRELMDLNYTLEQIYDILDRVYNSEPDTFVQPSSDAIQDYINDESAVYDVLPTNMIGNIDSALSDGAAVFDGNGAFSLIRSIMQGIAFNQPKFNGFILFSLAIGIAVLILGRRLNTVA